MSLEVESPEIQIEELIDDMYQATRHSRKELKILVYWSIATHGHESLELFPILRIFGGTNTGKTNSLHMVADLCRARQDENKNFQTGALFTKIKGSTDAAVRSLISDAATTGDSCIFDEADNFPYQFYESVYAKAGASVFKMQKEEGTPNFGLSHNINLWAPLAINGREVLPDESCQNRTIEITTKYDERGPRSTAYQDGEFGTYRQLCADIASEIPWEAIKAESTRVLDVWAPLRAVAEHLNDEDFLVYVNEVIAQTISEGKEGRADEGDHQVLNAMIELCHNTVVNHGRDFPRELTFKSIADEIGFTTREVGKWARTMGFETKKKGVYLVHRLTPKKVEEVRIAIGADEDEWLTGLLDLPD